MDFHEGNQVRTATSDLEVIDKNQHRLEEAAENQKWSEVGIRKISETHFG